MNNFLILVCNYFVIWNLHLKGSLTLFIFCIQIYNSPYFESKTSIVSKFFSINITQIFSYSIFHYFIFHFLTNCQKSLSPWNGLQHMKNSNPLINKLFFLYFPLSKSKFTHHFTPIKFKRSNFNIIHSISSFLQSFSFCVMKLILFLHCFHLILRLNNKFFIYCCCLV